MKKLLLASASILLLAASPVMAADVVVEETPIVDLPVGFSWTGAYLGVQAGYVWGNGNQQYTPTPNDYSTPDPDGFIGGVYVGYNYQLANNVVLGVDADWAWSGADGSSEYFQPGGVAGAFPGYSSELDVDWTAAARVRVGYAMDRWMPYVAGGVAIARVDYVGYLNGVEFDPGAKKTLTGWTIGAGTEYAFTDNLLLRAEYRYSDFGKAAYQNSYNDGELDLTSHDIRIGLSYKF